jgi:hypothetical protein
VDAFANRQPSSRHFRARRDLLPPNSFSRWLGKKGPFPLVLCANSPRLYPDRKSRRAPPLTAPPPSAGPPSLAPKLFLNKSRPKRPRQIRLASKLFLDVIRTRSLDQIRLKHHSQMVVICHRCRRRMMPHSASLCLPFNCRRRRLHSSSSCFPSSNMLPRRVLVHDRRFLISFFSTEARDHGWRRRLGVALREPVSVHPQIYRCRGKVDSREVLLGMLRRLSGLNLMPRNFSYHQSVANCRFDESCGVCSSLKRKAIAACMTRAARRCVGLLR